MFNFIDDLKIKEAKKYFSEEILKGNLSHFAVVNLDESKQNGINIVTVSYNPLDRLKLQNEIIKQQSKVIENLKNS